MSCIYFIKNKITNRMYIGQTVQPLQSRINQHMVGKTEIDTDMQRIGLNNFEYGIIEECNSEELDEKEIYYIAKYDTYYNEYNNQLGGRKTGKNKYDSIIEKVQQDYMNGMSMIDLNIKYKIRNESLRYYVNDLKRERNIEYDSISKPLICYTKEWKRTNTFKYIKDALRFINTEREKEGRPLVDKRNFYRTIRTACAKNGIASGYRWQYREDVIYNDMEFNSSLDKEAYIKGINCTCIDNIWYIKTEENELSDRKGRLQSENKHANKVPYTNKINKNELREIYQKYTVKELANMYKCAE